MNEFIQYIDKISLLNKEASEDLLTFFNTKTVQKGDFLLTADKACKYFYFIEEGLIKLFFYNGEKEFLMNFFRENMMFTELSSYLTDRPSKYMLLVLETTTVHYIQKDEIQNPVKNTIV